MKHIIKSCAKILKTCGYQVVESKEDVGLGYDACILPFGSDLEERPVSVQMLHFSQEAAVTLAGLEKTENPSNLSLLTFIMTNPAPIPPDSVASVLRLLALGNKMIPFGFLNCSELEKAVYYSYTWPIFEECPSELFLQTILHTAIFVRDSVFPIVNEIAKNPASIEEYVRMQIPQSK